MPNYNRPMSHDAVIRTFPRQRSDPPLHCGAFSLAAMAASDKKLEYCVRLAHDNMNPYLLRRGENFDDARWRLNAAQSEFFLVTKNIALTPFDIGFVSVCGEPDGASALHVGDIQIEPAQQNNGAGSAALYLVEKLARARGFSELTLNVFRDNPALALYERDGFDCIDTQFYKYKMRKVLHQRTEPT